LPLFLYLERFSITRLSDVTPFTCATYVQSLKTPRGKETKRGRALKPEALYRRLSAVEAPHTLSQHTSDAMFEHPWLESTAGMLAGGHGASKNRTKTQLMPDDVFSALFERAWTVVQGAAHVLDERDAIAQTHRQNETNGCVDDKGSASRKPGLGMRLTEIRTACYIIIASLTGCRNHELAFLGTDACYSSEDDDGEVYWWMRSRSTKTDEGKTEWMIPEAAVLAVRVMERWAEPYHAALRGEIEAKRAIDVYDPAIAVAQEHVGALFVGKDPKKGMQVRTLSLAKMNMDLKTFASACRVDWGISTHQFRRKFANYAARSQFGDLRYLRDHFKHWSLDMTLGYAMNESQEMELYLEIQEELEEVKQSVVATWLNKSEQLAGGYGGNIANWRAGDKPITLFKDRKQMIRSIAQSTSIRSNGHAWCTADDNQCVGYDLERTRCGSGCGNAVIGRQHLPIYQGLYDQLKEIEHCEDIGDGGRARVRRDLERCASVLSALGADQVETA
jgi:integrase